MATPLDERTRAWLDSLENGERERAKFLIAMPPEMAAARVDHDLRELISNQHPEAQPSTGRLRPAHVGFGAVGALIALIIDEITRHFGGK